MASSYNIILDIFLFVEGIPFPNDFFVQFVQNNLKFLLDNIQIRSYSDWSETFLFCRFIDKSKFVNNAI